MASPRVLFRHGSPCPDAVPALRPAVRRVRRGGLARLGSFLLAALLLAPLAACGGTIGVATTSAVAQDAGRATASTGDGAYAPEMALDGDMTTRWSSTFEDNQWWRVDFEVPRMLSGLTIHWETAFGERFNIEVAGPDGVFQKVYETEEGDGNRDIIHFAPRMVSTVKFNGVQRGTGWGFSFFEIDWHDGTQPHALSASTQRPDAAADLAMDGDLSSAWHSDATETADLTAQFSRSWDIGGLLLNWGADYARSYVVEGSEDSATWHTLYETTEGNGGKDWIYFAPIQARQVRIRCRESATGNGFALSEIELKGAEEKATPIKIYQALAKDAAPGLYPLWLRRLQEFWTVIGVPGDDEEALLSEHGSIEPYKQAFTVMPILLRDASALTYADCLVTQDLAESTLPLPGVSWRHADVNLDIRALAFGDPGASWSSVRYRVTNPGPESRAVSLALAILPVQVNPAWQRGGHSPIHELGFGPSGAAGAAGAMTVTINGAPRIFSPTPPSRQGAAGQREGGIVSFLARGEVPSSPTSRDNDGLASGALVYDLDVPPGASREVVLFYPMHGGNRLPTQAVGANPSTTFSAIEARERRRWSQLLNRFAITTPEPRLTEVMRSNIAYILINKDGPWIKPGARNYNHSWVRDGAMTCVALLRMGLPTQVRPWLDAVSPHVWEKGMVPYIFFEGGNPVGFDEANHSGEGKEFDSQGQFAFAVRQFYDYTGDRALLTRLYPKVLAAMRFQADLRRQRLTDEYRNDPAKRAYLGILPLSNSHEGYYPAMHSYWDDFWGLRGLKDAVHLAQVMGKDEDERWLSEELESFRSAVLASIKTVIAERGIDYIPGCVEKADFDPTSTSIAVMVTGDADQLPQDLLEKMYTRYFEEFTNGMTPGRERTFTPYEVRTAEAFVRMGQRDRALTMLRYLARDSVRPHGWNHMAEVVHARPRAPSYIGDMPHTWVGSGFISAVRSLFAYEQNDRLHVAAGFPLSWFDAGVSVQKLPTIYGLLDITITPVATGHEIVLGGRIRPPDGIELPLPRELADRTVLVDGTAVPTPGGRIRLETTPARILVRNP